LGSVNIEWKSVCHGHLIMPRPVPNIAQFKCQLKKIWSLNGFIRNLREFVQYAYEQ